MVNRPNGSTFQSGTRIIRFNTMNIIIELAIQPQQQQKEKENKNCYSPSVCLAIGRATQRYSRCRQWANMMQQIDLQ